MPGVNPIVAPPMRAKQECLAGQANNLLVFQLARAWMMWLIEATPWCSVRAAMVKT
jgi:hypothetical protein